MVQIKKKLFHNTIVKVTPVNLPMIATPKDFTINELGGYLLNDDTYKLDIMTNKYNYKYTSTISEDSNRLFYLVNNTNKVPLR